MEQRFSVWYEQSSFLFVCLFVVVFLLLLFCFVLLLLLLLFLFFLLLLFFFFFFFFFVVVVVVFCLFVFCCFVLFCFFIHSCYHTIGSCYTYLLPYFYTIEILYFYLTDYIVKCNCSYVIHGFENNAFLSIWETYDKSHFDFLLNPYCVNVLCYCHNVCCMFRLVIYTMK